MDELPASSRLRPIAVEWAGAGAIARMTLGTTGIAAPLAAALVAAT
jgi:hypothetical protein